jgi:hypothetical protein
VEPNDEKDTTSTDAMTAAELDLADKVHRRVYSFLKTQYLWLAVVVMILAPILGVLIGAVVESKIFTWSREQLLAKVKSESDEAEKRIRATSDEARKNLDEIRSTRQALDFVMRGTQTGDLTFLQRRSEAAAKQLKEFETNLSEWEKRLQVNIPQGLEKLAASGEELNRLRDAVKKLDGLFKSNDTAAALAGAFYRIDEFLGAFDVSLFVPKNVPEQPDLKAIVDSAKDVKAEIAFYRAGNDGNEQIVFGWNNLTPEIDIMSLGGDRKDAAELEAPQIGTAGQPSSSLLHFRWALQNQPSWWHISERGADSIKRVNLLNFSEFDTVRIALEFPKAAEPARKALASCTLSGNAYPKHLKLVAQVNRVEITLTHQNGSDDKVILNPYFGQIRISQPTPAKPPVAASAGKPAEPAVAEKQGQITFVFQKTVLFDKASSIYTQQLAAAVKPPPVKTTNVVGASTK